MSLGDAYSSDDALKEYLGITDDVDDTHITQACASVARWIEQHCSRQFNVAGSATARTYRATYSGFSPSTYSDWLDVDDISTLTGLIVKTDPGDDGTFETTWAVNTDYILHPLNGIVDGVTGWPYDRIIGLGIQSFSFGYRPLVEVTANWGWAAVPEPVQTASLIQASRIFKRRQSPEGVLGGYSDFGPVRVGTRLDPDVELMLAPYRRFPVLVA